MSLGAPSSKSGGSSFKNIMGNVLFGPRNWEEMQVKGLDRDPLDTLIGGDPNSGRRPRMAPLPDVKIPQVPLAPLPPAQRTSPGQSLEFRKAEEKEVPAPPPTLLDKRRKELYNSIMRIYRGGR